MITHDAFGPAYSVKINDPKIGLEGFLVIDNLALGPGKGGIRMTADITAEEVWRLARTMTWKNAIAGIPFGGAKAGIVWRGGSEQLKKQLIQRFARMIQVFTPRFYIAGPDVNTGAKEMQWFVEATGNWRSATGKPANICVKISGKSKKKCGIPHEFGSTGFGVAHAAAVAARLKGIAMEGTTVAIDGFGNVGSFACKYLQKMGAKIVAVADRKGTVYRKEGLDGCLLDATRSEGKSILNYSGGKKMNRNAVFTVPVDILIPASVTDIIHDKNKDKIKAKIIVEGANIPMNERIEDELFKKGILIVPDFVANAGGVISSYAEYRGYDPKKMFEIVEKKIKETTQLILEKSIKENINPRRIALKIAQAKIETAMTAEKRS